METENEKEQDDALDVAVTALLVLSDVRFMGCGATRDCRDHLASLPTQCRAQNHPELMPLSRAVLVALQQQGLIQPGPGFHVDLKWAPFCVLALICLCLCVYLCVYLYVYIYVYICIYVHTSVCVCGWCICTIVCPESFFQAGVQPIWSTSTCFTNDESYLCTSLNSSKNTVQVLVDTQHCV